MKPKTDTLHAIATADAAKRTRRKGMTTELFIKQQGALLRAEKAEKALRSHLNELEERIAHLRAKASEDNIQSLLDETIQIEDAFLIEDLHEHR